MSTTMTKAPDEPLSRVEVITSVQRRGRWSAAEEVRLVQEALVAARSCEDCPTGARARPGAAVGFLLCLAFSYDRTLDSAYVQICAARAHAALSLVFIWDDFGKLAVHGNVIGWWRE
jgi:hypothetical protein